MKKYLMLLLIAASSVAVKSQTKQEKQPYLTKLFSSQKINSVVSQTSGGNISVNAVNPSESRVEVFVSENRRRGNGFSNDEIRSKIENDYDFTVAVNNGTLTATAKSKHRITNWTNALSFSFMIYVPANVSTNLKTSGGNITLSGLSGNQDFATSGGNLELNELSGKIKGRTSGGNIYLKNCKDELNLATSGGNIMGKNSSGQIHLSTSGGSIQLKDLDGNIDASTSGGNVEAESIKGELAARTSGGNVSLQKLNCSVKTSTSGGNIDVSIETPGKYVSINNSGGQVRLSIPKNTGMDLKLSAMKISTQNLQNFNGSNSKDEIKGTVNGGGIPVTVDAGSGNLDVVFD
ncbi:MAG: hypothetical protein KGM16_03000 [Bacteroidota bacterium]|nr:hypothetical protein [Bacteroidota bacterium]